MVVLELCACPPTITWISNLIPCTINSFYFSFSTSARKGALGGFMSHLRYLKLSGSVLRRLQPSSKFTGHGPKSSTKFDLLVFQAREEPAYQIQRHRTQDPRRRRDASPYLPSHGNATIWKHTALVTAAKQLSYLLTLPVVWLLILQHAVLLSVDVTTKVTSKINHCLPSHQVNSTCIKLRGYLINWPVLLLTAGDDSLARLQQSLGEKLLSRNQFHIATSNAYLELEYNSLTG